MGKFIVVAVLATLSLNTFAGGGNTCAKRVVENANPQHAGYPKADKKGDMPLRIDTHRYVLSTCK